MPRLVSLAAIILLLVFSCAACGPRRLALPAGPGTPAADYATAFATAAADCRGVHTWQAELGLSGRVGRQRLRGRVLAGLAPGALRLEAVAPFGSPAFILVADGSRGTLLLLRDRRVLQNAPPAEILDALIGVPLGPDDLLAALSGCAKASAEPVGGREYGPDWRAIDLASGGVVFLQRRRAGWRIVAGHHSGLEIEYGRFTRSPGASGEMPAQIQIRSTAGATADVALTLGLDQIEVNGDLPRAPLVAVTIQPGLSPISLQELREGGPLGQRD